MKPTKKPQDLQKSFQSPPDDARIMVRWWLFGPAVTPAQLEREMAAMKQAGIGGFEFQPVYPLALDGQPPGLKNLRFMSVEFLDALRFVAQRGKKLGLRMDLTLGSGWPYGGPQFTRDEAACALLPLPPVEVMQGKKSVSLPPEHSETWRIIAALLGPIPGAKPELSHLPLKIKGTDAILPSDLKGATKVTFYVLKFAGRYQVKRPCVGAEGYVIDHYDPGVIGKFIREIAEPEIAACGKNKPYALFCDSLEVHGENWTKELLAEFKKRRGYDLAPLLPALADDSWPKAKDIRHDWGKTATELYNECFVSAFRKLAHKHGSKFRIQGYGTPPAALYSYACCDLPEGEGFDWKQFSCTRWASSAAHLLGKTVTSSETFTWLHAPPFRATPLDIKGEADQHFLCGINQIICHGWPFTAENIPYPGWSFYASAAINDKNPWWIVMPDLSKYLQRVSHVLRQGTPANDVALFWPNSDGWASFGYGRMQFSMNTVLERNWSTSVSAITESGFNFDFFDDQLLEMRGEVSGDALAFGKIRFRAVVLPGVERIPLATMKTLEKFAAAGGILVATRRLPDKAPGYLATDRESSAIQKLSRKLFAGKDALGIFIEDESKLGEVLKSKLAPDAGFSPHSPEIGAVHRHTSAGEIYFVANTGNREKEVLATFRVSGLFPEIWDPISGEAQPLEVVRADTATTTVKIALPAYGSAVVFFGKLRKTSIRSNAGRERPISEIALSAGWEIRFGDEPRSTRIPKLVSWTKIAGRANFSGVAAYSKEIEVPAAIVEKRLVLDFGPCAPGLNYADWEKNLGGHRAEVEPPVREAAVLYINDKRAGCLWHPPYSLDLTGRLKPGKNQVRIEVGNLAINHMSSIKLPNYDFDGLAKKFGVRFANNLNLKIEPLTAGLLGPIVLRAYVK